MRFTVFFFAVPIFRIFWLNMGQHEANIGQHSQGRHLQLGAQVSRFPGAQVSVVPNIISPRFPRASDSQAPHLSKPWWFFSNAETAQASGDFHQDDGWIVGMLLS